MNIFKFFDQFGIIVFAFILLDALFEYREKRATWRTHVRAVIGVAGLLVDGFLVFFF